MTSAALRTIKYIFGVAIYIYLWYNDWNTLGGKTMKIAIISAMRSEIEAVIALLENAEKKTTVKIHYGLLINFHIRIIEIYLPKSPEVITFNT